MFDIKGGDDRMTPEERLERTRAAMERIVNQYGLDPDIWEKIELCLQILIAKQDNLELLQQIIIKEREKETTE